MSGGHGQRVWVKAFGLNGGIDGDYMPLRTGFGTEVLDFKTRDLARSWLVS